METALRPEDASEFNFPRELNDCVREKGMAQRQVGRALINIGTIIECTRFRHGIRVAVDEGAVSVRLPGICIGDQRHNPPKTVREHADGEEIDALAGLDFAGERRIDDVINGVGKRVICLQGETVRHPLLKTDREAVVRSLSPRTVTLNFLGSRAGNELVGVAWHSRFKRQVRSADCKDVFDILVVVIQGKYHVGANLTLDTHVVVECVGNLKMRVHRYWNSARSAVDTADCREIAKGIPSPIVGWYGEPAGTGKSAGEIRHRGIRGLQELVGGEARDLLNIVDVHEGVRWNRSVSRSDNGVEVIDAVVGGAPRCRWRGVVRARRSEAHGRDLGIRQIVRYADGGTPRSLKDAR